MWFQRLNVLSKVLHERNSFVNLSLCFRYWFPHFKTNQLGKFIFVLFENFCHFLDDFSSFLKSSVHLFFEAFLGKLHFLLKFFFSRPLELLSYFTIVRVFGNKWLLFLVLLFLFLFLHFKWYKDMIERNVKKVYL